MILDIDPFTGITKSIGYDHATDTTIIKTEQDCTSLIADNRRQVIEANHSQQIRNDWIKYASVPYVVIDKWRNELGINFMTTDPEEWKVVMALINSRDWRDLKTTTIHHDR